MSVNAVSRTYPADVERAWQAVTSALKELELKTDESAHDALGGRLTAERATGETVEVRVRMMDMNSTRVDVAVDPADRNMAQAVQNRVSEKLGGSVEGAPGGAVGSGSSAEGTYDNPLDEAVAAAEQAFQALNLKVEHREQRDIWASLRTRAMGTIPVQILMQRTPKDQTEVTFGVGTSRGTDNEAIAERLKQEFEAALKQEAQPQRPQEPKP
jgi:hypothetical protein